VVGWKERRVEYLALVLRHEGRVTHLTCEGTLKADNVEELNEAVTVAIDTEPTELRLDTTRLTYIGFAGVIALLRAARWCSESEIALCLDPGRVVADALDVAGLSWLEDSDQIRALDKDREVALRDQALDRLVRTPYLI
jgi:anti-anti-sigma factor